MIPTIISKGGNNIRCYAAIGAKRKSALVNRRSAIAKSAKALKTECFCDISHTFDMTDSLNDNNVLNIFYAVPQQTRMTIAF